MVISKNDGFAVIFHNGRVPRSDNIPLATLRKKCNKLTLVNRLPTAHVLESLEVCCHCEGKHPYLSTLASETYRVGVLSLGQLIIPRILGRGHKLLLMA